MSQKIDYHEGKIVSIVQTITALIKRNPVMLDNPAYLMANLREIIPELKDKTKCPNCEASMKEWIFLLDAWDALLLLAMADEVDHRRGKGMNFTVANQVHVSDLPVSHAVKCRTTQSAKLGLVTQLRKSDGKAVQGVWVITKRGWKALGGERVPRMVKVWRNRIQDRFEETITLAEALESHKLGVEQRIKQGKTVKEDYREQVARYDSSRWLNYDLHEGQLF